MVLRLSTMLLLVGVVLMVLDGWCTLIFIGDNIVVAGAAVVTTTVDVVGGVFDDAEADADDAVVGDE